ncbi:MAG TPA: Holliday junction branch migration protein RuvA [Coriobacteriia bacterium]|nr:Holliday junction branch migration protein RuvA [Coriobacteriia bacterium]
MIAQLTGRITAKTACAVIIDVGGVGFQVSMSTSSLVALPAEGDEVTVHTHLHVREEELSLFGFESAEEKTLFEQLITVSGVGPKVALSVLSAFNPGSFADALSHEDVALISSVPGIGKKTAQRLILDLKDRLSVAGSMTQPKATQDSATEVYAALVGMGFSSIEVTAALSGYDGSPGDVQALLKYGLRRLGGGV